MKTKYYKIKEVRNIIVEVVVDDDASKYDTESKLSHKYFNGAFKEELEGPRGYYSHTIEELDCTNDMDDDNIDLTLII